MEKGGGHPKLALQNKGGAVDMNDFAYSTMKLLVLIPIVLNPPPLRALKGGNQARVLMIHCACACQPEDASVS